MVTLVTLVTLATLVTLSTNWKGRCLSVWNNNR